MNVHILNAVFDSAFGREEYILHWHQRRDRAVRAVLRSLKAKVAEMNAEDNLKTTADVMELLDEMIGPEDECKCMTNGYAVCRTTYSGDLVCVRCGARPSASAKEIYFDGPRPQKQGEV